MPQPVNTNKALVTAIDQLTKLQIASERSLRRIRTAALRDLEAGARVADVDVAYLSAIEAITEKMDAIQESIDELADRLEEDQPEEGEEPEFNECDEWVEDAREEFDGVRFKGDSCDCKDCNYHTSPIFPGISEAVAYASGTPVLWWIDSDDCGNTFYVVICDNS